MLTSQLRELEEQGLIRRIVHPQVPPKVEYSVTGYGETLKPVLFMMHEWGLAHLDRSEHDQLQQMPNLQVKSWTGMICIFDYMDNKYLLTSGHGLLRGLKFIFL